MIFAFTCYYNLKISQEDFKMFEAGLWGISGLASAFRFLSDQDAISAKKGAIKREMEEQEIATYNRMRQEENRFQQVSGQHLAIQGTGNVTAGSYAPVNFDELNNLSQDVQAEHLNLSMKQFEAANEQNALDKSRVFIGARDLFGVASGAAKTKILDDKLSTMGATDDKENEWAKSFNILLGMGTEL